MWWVVRASWEEPPGASLTRQWSFTDEQVARAFIAAGRPDGDVRPDQPPVEARPVRWELSRCTLESGPWIFRPASPHLGSEEEAVRLHRALLMIREYFVDACDSVLAFDWGGNRVEGALDDWLRDEIRRGYWFGMQLYRGDRTLYHLDDGCDVWFVLDAPSWYDLQQRGVEPRMIEPERPGDTLERMTHPEWRGG